MPRLPEILDRNALPPDKQQIFDYLASTRGSVRVPFSVVLNSPEVAARVSHLGTYLRFESSLPKAVTELATLAVARHFDSAHEWGMHAGFAKEAGVSDMAIDAVGRDIALGEEISRDEAFPVRFAREFLLTHSIAADTFEEARRRYGDTGAIDLAATVGYYVMMACLLAAIEVIPPPTLPSLPERG
jgi:4-carboxymuconolactone decarboxylase